MIENNLLQYIFCSNCNFDLLNQNNVMDITFQDYAIMS